MAARYMRVDADSLVSPPCGILLIRACISQATIARSASSCIVGRRYNAPMEACSRPDSWRAAMLVIVAFVACLASPLATAKTSSAEAEIRIDALPAEAREALERIRIGGPLPY